MRNAKPIALSGALCAAIAGYFWTQSRIPQLGEKAMMGGRSAVASLSFGELFPVEETMPMWKRIGLTALNWGNTNWRGMTFGLLFAAAFLTLLGFALEGRKRSTGSVIANTLLGVLVGAPLGLCANCATPIGRGMQAAGLRAETALAALFSSPTLNPIVLTMLFTLFSAPVAITKLSLTLVFLLVLVPLIARSVARGDEAGRDEAGSLAALEQSAYLPSRLAARLTRTPEVVIAGPAGSGSAAATEGRAAGWGAALRETGAALLGNLAFILLATLPMMVLAGVLGAAAVQAIPLQTFFDVKVSSSSILAASVIGAFLPVPMAFDVLAVSIFVNAGLPLPLGAALLFTLGVFSVYPFLVIWRALSPAAALSLLASVIALGAVAGHVTWAREAAEGRSLRATLDDGIKDAESGARGEIELARRRCDELPPGGQPGHCFAAFVRQRVAAGEGAALCAELAPGSDDRSRCEREARHHAAVRASVVAGDTRPCKEVAPPDEDACRTAAIEALARNDLSRMLALCGDFADPERARRCRREGLNGWLVQRGDATLCQYLDSSEDAEACGRFATLARAVLERRPEACQALDATLGPQCMRMLGDALVKDLLPSDDVKSCEALAGYGLAERCTAQWIDMRVRVTGDAALCERLPAGARPTRDECLETSLLRRLDRELLGRRIAALSPGAQGAAPSNAAPAASSAPAPLPPAEPPPPSETVLDDAALRVTATPHAARTGGSGDGRATRMDGRALGIDLANEWRALDVKEPFAYGRGIASGDVDGDGRPDLVLATPTGFALYVQRGGRFMAARVMVPEVARADAFLVALVDLDNDGWLDLFLGAYGGADYVVWNDHAAFSAPRVTEVQSGGAVLTMAAAFGDLDGDGLLDVVLGNWSFGAEKAFIPERSHNRVLLSRPSLPGRFESVPLDEVPGETLSVLLSDLDGDGRLDLLVGNDHDRPDQYYLGEGGGRFRPITPASGLLPQTPMHTMSIDSADLDNDGRLDVFATDMSFASTDGGDYCAAIADAGDRERCARGLTLDGTVKNRDVEACRRLPSEAARGECTVMVMVELALRSRDEALCERIPAGYPSHRAFCRNLIGRSHAEPFRLGEHLPQKARNALLMARPGSGFTGFTERAAAMGAAASYWSWNARAFDVDDDGWQDLYVANGFRFSVVHPNVLFHSERGQRFTRREKELGLDDPLDTPAFTSFDLDGDGDLDLVSTTENGPVRVHKNEEAKNHALSVALRDERGNRFGVGARVIVKSASGTQLREIKAGGGFLSFDPPVAHFGLGSDARVESVEVRWPSGPPTVLRRPLAADRSYVITRKAPPATTTPAPAK